MDDYYHAMAGSVGTLSESITRDRSFDEVMASKLGEIRDSLSAVSLDEEMANLMKFQHAYTAAAKLISTADDYFSLVLMTVYFAVAFFAIPNNYETSEWPLILFFVLTAFFLMYVPFSKIGHYLYYPFTRYFIGRTMGHRGVDRRKRGDTGREGH